VRRLASPAAQVTAQGSFGPRRKSATACVVSRSLVQHVQRVVQLAFPNRLAKWQSCYDDGKPAVPKTHHLAIRNYAADEESSSLPRAIETSGGHVEMIGGFSETLAKES
jgi:hypothetical protein